MNIKIVLLAFVLCVASAHGASRHRRGLLSFLSDTTSAISDTVQAAVSNTESAINSVVTIPSSIVSTVQDVSAVAENVTSAVTDTASSALDAVANVTSSLTEALQDTVSSAASTVSSVVSTEASAVSDLTSVASLLSSLSSGNFVTVLLSLFQTFLTSAVTWLKSSGILELASCIISAFMAVGSEFVSLFETVVPAVIEVFSEALTDTEACIEDGNFLNCVTEGAVSLATNSLAEMSDMSDEVGSIFTSVLALPSSVGTCFSNSSTSLSTLISTVNSTVTSLLSA